MELKFTEEEEAFRQEICDFVAENLDNEVRTHLRNGFFPTKEMIVDWQRKLNVRGWATPRWPVEWGGTDWSASKVYIFHNQTEALFAPQPLNFNVSMIGPVILQFGSEAQKKRFLPGIANLDDWWCQGFSEPGAGSDLAALQTKCTWDGEQWVVNGQKTWTTYAPACRLDVHPCAHIQQRQKAGGYFLSLDRHEKPRYLFAPDPNHGWRVRNK